ncbi:MAG TPA: acetyl-CoA carboxylase biotin carboxyl carrier protein [Thermoanaerobaculia bacterium]|nr:acetyl-CoA carboxylase biotin carboxyl carrier protein [Thermoanaerobaculia bacterium]
MKHSEILELIDKVAETGIHSVEIEHAGTKVKIEGKSSTPAQVIHVGEMKSESAPLAVPSTPAQSEASKKEEKLRAEEESEAGLHIITSPIVGTFYRTPSPESPAFVNVGDRITKGKVLCIVEAMKLMNEIESDIDGVIAKIYPQNGQPVEYGEKLFAVKV